MGSTNHQSQRNQLLKLARVIDDHPDWWRFPEQEPIQGFLGTDPIFIVGDQPSMSNWGALHRCRRTFYGTLKALGLANAHLTDLYKKRGEPSELKNGLPRDFHDHLDFFRREIDILKPTRIVALGRLADRLLRQHAADLEPAMRPPIWHFSYVVRTDRGSEYQRHMRNTIWGN